jgi:hypothetical protein
VSAESGPVLISTKGGRLLEGMITMQTAELIEITTTKIMDMSTHLRLVDKVRVVLLDRRAVIEIEAVPTTP